MSPFTFSAYTTGILTFGIGVFVLLNKRNVSVSKAFFRYSSDISLWAILTATHSIATSKDVSNFCAKIMHIPVPLIPILFFHFVLIFLKLERIKSLRITLLIGYVFAFMIGITAISTNLIVAGVEPKLGYRYFMNGGPLYFIVIAFFVLYASAGLTILLKKWLSSKGLEKLQLLYLFVGSLVGYSFGAGNFLPVYNITVFPYPYGSFGITLYVFVMAFAIARYRFLDIEVIIRKTLVFAGLLAFVFGMFSFGALVSQELLVRYFGLRWELGLGVSIFLIGLGYEPMRAFLIKVTDKHLFQKKYDYQKFLKDATKGMAQIESLHHLLGLVTHFITMRMRVRGAAILTRDLQEESFRLSHLRGYPAEFGKAFCLSAQNDLIRYLKQEKEGVDIARVKEYIQEGVQKKPQKGQAAFRYNLLKIKQQMEELRAACCIPSFLGKELRNILVLGEKKSGNFYTSEDLNVLFTIAQESAIAIENARLYDEALHRSQELQRINEEVQRANQELRNTQAQLIHEQKMATLGRLAASVGHEVNNPLTILSMNVSRAILRYKKTPEMKVVEILDIFQKMEQNIGRIKAVVNTLTGLLKKSEKGKFEPLSLKLILEETLPLVQFQTYLENTMGTEVEFDIPSNLPLIKGDLERLQEVFLNLFINAYHALAGRRNPKIVVKAHLLEEDSRMVGIEFVDNGNGMPEEIQKKIFTYGFTTKGPGRGSGMGLYICKYIIELHGGEIKVKSQQGQGTTFTLTLPAFEETNPIGIPAGGTLSA